MARKAGGGVSIVIEGGNRFAKKLDKLPIAMRKKIMRKALRAAARPVLKTAKSTVPVKTGKLKRSLSIRSLKRSRKGFGVRVGTKEGFFLGQTFYGGFLEYGWRFGKRPSKSTQGTGLDKRRKIPGRFWLGRALKINIPRSMSIIAEQLKIGLREAFRNG